MNSLSWMPKNRKSFRFRIVSSRSFCFWFKRTTQKQIESPGELVNYLKQKAASPSPVRIDIDSSIFDLVPHLELPPS